MQDDQIGEVKTPLPCLKKTVQTDGRKETSPVNLNGEWVESNTPVVTLGALRSGSSSVHNSRNHFSCRILQTCKASVERTATMDESVLFEGEILMAQFDLTHVDSR